MFFFQNEEINHTFKPRSIEHAYLAILNDDLKTAEAVFESIDSPRAKWGVSLTQIINGFIERFPTYFEIRNFLEIDLDYLIKNEKIDYTEQLLGSLDILAKYNQETYKYAARTMFENKFQNAAKEYLDKSKKIFYKDPELHFMYAKYHLNLHNYQEALFHINECLKIMPDYFPAKKLKEDLLSKRG